MGTWIRRALISVYDKTGIVEFARTLHATFGIEILSTGGTARTLHEAGIPVTPIEDITGFPELLGGRVKTLHPKIHAAILADRDNPEHMRQLREHGIEPIDMVVVNLYPFEKTIAEPGCTFEQAIEMIDIGGVALLRAAAKNHKHVVVMSHADLYATSPTVWNLDNAREEWARHAIWTTAGYDAAISEFLGRRATTEPQFASIKAVRLAAPRPLRYGENPVTQAAAYEHARYYEGDLRAASQRGPSALGTLIEGATDPSFNNLLDADAALGLCAELTRAAQRLGDRLQPACPPVTAGRPAHQAGLVNPSVCCFIKHTNACGVGVARDAHEAYRRAYLGDPNAAMGGVLAVNVEVTADFATMVMETYDRLGKTAGAGGFFVEVWIAPAFQQEAIRVIRGTATPTQALPKPPKKPWGETVRLLAVGDMAREPDPNELQYRSIAGGMLVQTPDLVGLNEEQWKVVTTRPPTDAEAADLRLAWLIAKHTKSNAISICKDGMLIGNGAGQMSRVMSCRVATWLANENGHANKMRGAAAADGAINGPVAASDAFFPFRDGPDILIDAGVTAIIQPGGSRRDEETIAACDERGVAMIFTGTRHFRH